MVSLEQNQLRHPSTHISSLYSNPIQSIDHHHRQPSGQGMHNHPVHHIYSVHSCHSSLDPSLAGIEDQSSRNSFPYSNPITAPSLFPSIRLGSIVVEMQSTVLLLSATQKFPSHPRKQVGLCDSQDRTQRMFWLYLSFSGGCIGSGSKKMMNSCGKYLIGSLCKLDASCIVHSPTLSKPFNMCY